MKIPNKSSVRSAATCIFHQNIFINRAEMFVCFKQAGTLWSITQFSFCPNLLICLIQRATETICEEEKKRFRSELNLSYEIKASLYVQVLNYDALTGLMTGHHIFKVMQNENQAQHGVN